MRNVALWAIFVEILKRCNQHSTSQDLHGPGDVGFRYTIHQTLQGNIGLWSAKNLFLLFFQTHSRRDYKNLYLKFIIMA